MISNKIEETGTWLNQLPDYLKKSSEQRRPAAGLIRGVWEEHLAGFNCSGVMTSMGKDRKFQLTLNSKDSDTGTDQIGGLETVTAKPKLKQPPMYKVILLNDDFTPMEFVVEVLQVFFGMNREKATQVMLAVHTTGKAVCGIFTRDVAETKSVQVNQYAQDNQHPLVSDIEAAA